MDIVKENDKMVSVHFDSILEIINRNHPSENPENVRRMEMYMDRKSRGPHWLGIGMASGNEVVDAALIGNRKMYNDFLVPRINQLKGSDGVKDSEQSIKMVKRRKIHDIMGDELDIHKVYQGQLDKAWSRTERVEVSQKFHLVTLFIEYTGNADENAMNSLWRSAVAVKLTEELEMAGKSVQIVVGSATARAIIMNEKVITTSVVIKRFNEKLSLERLSAMTHLGFFRTVGFAAMLSQSYPLAGNLGHTIDITENTMPIHLKEEIDEGHTKFVHIGRADSLQSAKNELGKCYGQMKEFAGEH